ncbi:Hypp9070 [Branchiostoma lanceolatum]|uniref:Hypp9070 protein n=1 Tax=Branchiostoma lanceolatum TaxID=7740 RepID=A0A8K0EFT3_BRALA|nr:Hypp9070 [Branchiostoma lanceolatum]
MKMSLLLAAMLALCGAVLAQDDNNYTELESDEFGEPLRRETMQSDRDAYDMGDNTVYTGVDKRGRTAGSVVVLPDCRPRTTCVRNYKAWNVQTCRCPSNLICSKRFGRCIW